ncbi:DNA invertase Pin-like site-specific DNA recombinase [Rhodococcus percolatus]|uniref:recombinase family protein n=1 Tax=Rhodococcus opacus TaxID=37919 RepID=UPI0015FB7D75|nr:recombinase family protein [Rhodococcus opacus]MBA8964747.1 DNA invertase Pin-like site-specific DNA recombinase [Rhodococcus opacus]MBP2208299.1 DNA invertase Pin-like site-specific DNA recombinase [Rhodococcus opacus]
MTTTETRHLVGYARVSTTRQNLDRQLDAIDRMGASKTFVDKVTGRTMGRPGWEQCREYLRSGDTLLVDNLDRLGRTALEVIATVNELAEAGVVVQSIAQGVLDPSTANGRLMIGMFSMLAEFEVDLKAERAAAAREAAAARGKHTGRPKALTDEQVQIARQMREAGGGVQTICDTFGISRATLYRVLAD